LAIKECIWWFGNLQAVVTGSDYWRWSL